MMKNTNHDLAGGRKSWALAAWLAASTALTLWGGYTIFQTWTHHGPGVVVYSAHIPDPRTGDGGDDVPTIVPESKYKRQHYVDGVLFAGLGVFLLASLYRSHYRA